MDLNSYRKKKEVLKSNFQKLYAIADDLQLHNQMKFIKDSIHHLDEETFNLVVVGEFSRGKSTFINAMLGRRILPSRKNPTTAIISKIVYGDEPEYFLHYRDERKGSEQVEEERFFKLTAPKEAEDGSIKKKEQAFLDSIDYAKIAYPLSFCKDNVEIVDTPGTNDLNEGRVEITYRYLNQADAVILLLSATQALSASETEFLKERILGNHIKDIFFVLSRKDSLNDDEVPRVLNFVQKSLVAILPDNVSLNQRIFLVSSLQTLYYRRLQNGDKLSAKAMMKVPDSLDNTGFIEFEDTLAEFLSEDKGRVKINKYVAQSSDAIRKIAQDLEVRIAATLHSADEIKAKAAKLEPEFQSSKHAVQQITQNMHRNLANSLDDIVNKCVIAGTSIKEAACRAVDEYNESLSDQKKLGSVINKAIEKEQKRIIDELQSISNEIIRSEVRKAQTGLAKIWADIAVEYQQTFNLPAVVKLNEDYGVPATVWDNKQLEESLSSGFADLGFEKGGFISTILTGLSLAAVSVFSSFMSFFSGKSKEDRIKDKIKDKIIDNYKDVSDNLSKSVKDQYSRQIDIACDSIDSIANARIEDMRQQLQVIIAEKEQKEYDAEQERQNLLAKRAVLYKVSSAINELRV